MIRLTIDLGDLGSETAIKANQHVSISHFKFQNITREQAQEGLRHSPGIVIVMPRPDQENYLINGAPLVVPPAVSLLLNGENHNVLVPANDDDEASPRQPSFGVIEINATINESYRLRDRLKLPSWLNRYDSKKISDLYHDLIYGDSYAQQTSQYGNGISMHLAAARLVNLILNAADQSISYHSGSKSEVQLQSLKEYLLANLSCRITTQDMADHIGLSRAHFCTRAKSLLGDAPMSYLRRIRLERSLELLEHTNESIDEVAFQVGYTDRFSFSKEFKKHYGYSPVQYRKRSSGMIQTEAYAKAQALYDQRRYEQAVAVCKKALRKGGSGEDTAQVLYLQGRCLIALGYSNEALDVWNQLEGSAYAWQAGMQCCRLYFQTNHFDEALAELEKLWARADSLQHNDVIQTWMEQVSALNELRRHRPMRRYLDFRKKYFATDQQSKMTAVRGCRNIGLFLEILEQCPDDKGTRFRALKSAGEYEHILELYGSQLDDVATVNMNDIASVYMDAGQYDKVLALEPEIPARSAAALTQLGRPQEAIKRFPNEAIATYLELEMYEEVLDRTSSPCFERIYALHALEREEELKTFDTIGSWMWHFAQLYLRPDYILKLDYPETYMLIPSTRLLLALQPGNSKRDVMQHIDAIPKVDSNEFWPRAHEAVGLLLTHIIPTLLGERDDLQKTLRLMAKEWRYFDKQKLYHAASYLAGDIDFNAWRQQPFQFDIEARGRFIQTLKNDLENKPEKACQGYQAYIDSTSIYGIDKLFSHRFAEWRLATLL